MLLGAACIPRAVRAQLPAYGGEWGGYGTGPGQFVTPVAAAEGPDGSVFVVDSRLKRVQVFTPNGAYVRGWMVRIEGPRSLPTGIAVDAGGDVYVTDVEQSQVQKYSSDGTLLTIWGSSGQGQGQLRGPYSIAVDADGYVYVAESANDRVQKFTSSGESVTVWGSFGYGPGQFDNPQGIAVSPFGIVYVVDFRDGALQGRIQRFSKDGVYLGTQFPGAGYWVRVAVDRGGVVYAVDNRGARVGMYTSTGAPLGYWGSAGTGVGEFLNPIGISTSHLLNSNMRVYVCDTNNSRIQVFGDRLTPVTASSWGRVKSLFR